MFAILGWFIRGGIVSTLATAALASSIGFGTGYLKGWWDTDKSFEIAALHAIIANNEAEKSAAASATAAANAQAEADAKAENETAVVNETLEQVIERSIEKPSSLSPAFLSGLRRLK